MKTITVLLAGAMIASATLAAQTDDSLSAERYKAKYGRYSSVEEHRRDQAIRGAKYVAQACCREMKLTGLPSAARVAGPGTDAWTRVKYGRSTPPAEEQDLLTSEHAARHVRTCAQLNICPLVPASEIASRAGASPFLSEGQARLQAKYGRSDPAFKVRSAPVGQREEFAANISRVTPSCQHECCTHDE